MASTTGLPEKKWRTQLQNDIKKIVIPWKMSSVTMKQLAILLRWVVFVLLRIPCHHAICGDNHSWSGLIQDGVLHGLTWKSLSIFTNQALPEWAGHTSRFCTLKHQLSGRTIATGNAYIRMENLINLHLFHNAQLAWTPLLWSNRPSVGNEGLLDQSRCFIS